MKKASVLLALILSGTSSLAWAGVCVLDAPGCACFKDTGAWNPSGDLLTVAAQTLGTTESCTKDGGKPFYQMQAGISDRSEAQILSFSKIFVGRRPWCSETVAYWHLEARVPYDRGYGGVWWHPSWQMASTDDLRSWYKAEEGLGGRARWIDSTELDLRNFSPGINAPCPGAYQQIMGYEPNPFGLPSWSVPWLSPWEGTSNAHSQVVESMVLYYFNDDLVGDVVDFDLQMIEGNAGAGGKVINTRVHARAARYTPQGGDSPDDFIGNGRKIRGWGIDRDANGDPLCAYDRITKKRWPYQFVPEYDSDPHIEVDKYDEYQISKYRQFQRAIEANDGLRVRINQANPSYYTLPTERDPWVIELVDGKADILVGFPLPLPYPFGSVEIHFEGRHRPDEMSARALNNRADAKRGGHRMSAWQRLDEGTGRAILVFSGPTTAADILFQLIGKIEPGHAAKVVVSALYFHPYADLSREDSDHNPGCCSSSRSGNSEYPNGCRCRTRAGRT